MEPLPQRQRLFHTPPPWVKSGEIFFITICCSERTLNQLANPATFAVMTSALEQYMRAAKLWARLFLAMPDHLHVLAAFPADQKMEGVLRNWKRFVAKQAGVDWQDGFFDHRLRQQESLEKSAHYIRMNPVRAGFVTEPEEWRYVWPPNGAQTAG